MAFTRRHTLALAGALALSSLALAAPVIVGPVNIPPGLPGGASTAEDITAAAVIKAAPGIIVRIVPIVLGTGTLTINDAITTGGATTANTVESIPVASMTVGVPVTLELACGTGIVISAFPTGGQYVVTFT
jgi:hypothetical protein